MFVQVSAVSAVVNWGTSPKAFVFRNYNHKPGALSRYAGASGCQMWQAVRASSAAPGYFQEFPLQSDIHQVQECATLKSDYEYCEELKFGRKKWYGTVQKLFNNQKRLFLSFTTPVKFSRR